MSALPEPLRRVLRHDTSPPWFDRSYLLDWAAVAALWILSSIPDNMPVFEREFSPNDPLINHTHKKQQLSGSTNGQIALYVPLIIACAAGVARRSSLEIHHAALSVFAGRGLSRLITEFLKNIVGRLRPDFLARCKWDVVTKVCKGKHDTVLDGRRSFPSGHSSAAWAGMFFLFLWIAGHTGALCFGMPSRASSWVASRMWRLMLMSTPLWWATWVAVSRVEDYRHHKEDVIVGSLIGAASALATYLMFWRSPFSRASFTSDRRSPARVTYGDDGEGTHDTHVYELGRLADDGDAV